MLILIVKTCGGGGGGVYPDISYVPPLGGGGAMAPTRAYYGIPGPLKLTCSPKLCSPKLIKMFMLPFRDY